MLLPTCLIPILFGEKGKARLIILHFRDTLNFVNHEGLRDHPRMIMYIHIKLLTWLAKCDTQPIIDRNFLALLNISQVMLAKELHKQKNLFICIYIYIYKLFNVYSLLQRKVLNTLRRAKYYLM